MAKDNSTAAKTKKVKTPKKETVSRRLQIANLCGGTAGAHDSVAKLQEAIADIRRRVDNMQECINEVDATEQATLLLQEATVILDMFPADKLISKMRSNFWDMKYAIK